MMPAQQSPPTAAMLEDGHVTAQLVRKTLRMHLQHLVASGVDRRAWVAWVTDTAREVEADTEALVE